MIVYSTTIEEFLQTESEAIKKHLSQKVAELFGEVPSPQEERSWDGSIKQLQNVFEAYHLPEKSGISLEYNIPISSNRIDCIVSGKNAEGKLQAVLIELKGWVEAEKTDIPETVKTLLGQSKRFTSHPSSQVKWYSEVLKDNEEVIQENQLEVHPCAYLYNCRSQDVIKDEFYNEITTAAPPFCCGEESSLVKFIKERISLGDECQAVDKLEQSRITASKRLLNSVKHLMNDEEYFRLSPEQKLVFNRVIRAVKYQEDNGGKYVLILHGGPGTGKSVIAIDLVFKLLSRSKEKGRTDIVRYFAKNKAPRQVLTEAMTDAGATLGTARNLIAYPNPQAFAKGMHVAIVDEAHRLVDSRGIDMVELIIKKSDVTVFFLDEKQFVTTSDIGTNEHIISIAKKLGATHKDLGALVHQFRSGITDWVLKLLQYDGHIGYELPGNTEYDFRIYENPERMVVDLKKVDSEGKKARIVAGYTREWISNKDPQAYDWDLSDQGFPDFNFMWNLGTEGAACWATRQGFDRIGCVHTAQGMEFDYIGVIISKDIDYRDGKIVFLPENHALDDTGIPEAFCKPISQLGPSAAKISELIRNTYFVLMSRGMKGCYVYAENPGMRDYIKSLVGENRVF